MTLEHDFDQHCEILPNFKYLKLNCNNLYIINSLPNSIVELELDRRFNLKMDNLPTSIKKLVINKYSNYDQDLNCLPDYIEELQLNSDYKKRILKIPSKLKKIICHNDYPYKDDFVKCDYVQTYRL